MKRDLSFEIEYPHPPEKVWQAISSREALEAWLMPNDFQPEVGHEFTFRTDPAPGFDGIVHCKVLQVDPPRTLSYSWKGGALDTVVTWTLEPTATGTILRLRHAGFAGLKAILVSFILGGGWGKMSRTKLPAVLDRLDDDGTLRPEAAPTPAEACRKRGVSAMLGRAASWLPGRRSAANN